MTDYRTLLRHAGLPDDEVERIASQAEADDRTHHMQEADENDRSLYIEKHIQLVLRQVGLQLWDSHSIIVDADVAEVAISDEGHGIPVAQILDFANKIAGAGLGSDVKITGNDGALRLSFKIL